MTVMNGMWKWSWYSNDEVFAVQQLIKSFVETKQNGFVHNFFFISRGTLLLNMKFLDADWNL